MILSADTLRLSPVGATGTLAARLYDATGTELTGRLAKLWTGTTGPATLSQQICAFPCTVKVTSKAVGEVKVVAYWYAGPSSALRDTAWVVVSSTVPASRPPPSGGPPPPPPPGGFIGPDVAALPTTGLAWTSLRGVADRVWTRPNLCDRDNKADVQALAGALVYARTGTASYKTKVVAAIQGAAASQVDGCATAVLALGRQLGGWVLAADYVGYRDPKFLAWLSQIRTRNIGGHGVWYTLRRTAQISSNNWGTWALASLIAADRYLGDATAVAQDWAIFHGYGDGTWPFRADQDDIGTTSDYLPGWNCRSLGVPGRYRAIEDLRCGGPDKNGAPVEDASRSGNTITPDAGYVQEAISGYTVQAILLARAGYDAWRVNNQQVKRVADFQTRFGIFNSYGGSYFVAWVLNKTYRTNYPARAGSGGRMIGYTDWLYGG